MNNPLVKGPLFAKGDAASKAHVTLINQSLAKIIGQSGDPIGKIVEGDTDADALTIGGVVGDVHQAGLNAPPLPEIYFLTDNATASYQEATRSTP